MESSFASAWFAPGAQGIQGTAVLAWPEVFATFVGRDEGLCKIKRYLNYPRMLYRTDLCIHAKRVARLVEHYGRGVATVNFSWQSAIMHAFVHDDIEIITGDLQTANKVVMLESEFNAHKEKARRAFVELIEKYPKLCWGYSYQSLLAEVEACARPETMFVKVLDKLEGLCEACHEVIAGNVSFLENNIDSAGRRLPNPFEYYEIYFKKLCDMDHHEPMRKLARECGLLDIKFQGLQDYLRELSRKGRPHQIFELRSRIGIPFYDEWKKIHAGCLAPEVIRSLVEIKEK